jgi:hypothetical protein
MTYSQTVRAVAQIERPDPTANNRVVAEHAAARKLPMSEWAESRRDTMTPATIAQNHAMHVSDTAFSLRDALARADQEGNTMMRLATLADVEDAARALLAAIGEGHDA